MSSPPDLVPLYYLSGIGLAVASGFAALRTWSSNQRARWVKEGKRESDLDATMIRNTEAAEKNTEAIGLLVDQMKEFSTFMTDTRRQLNGHEQEILELRRWREHQG